MSVSLWSANTPARFWACQPEIPEQEWQAAIWQAVPILGLANRPRSLDSLLGLILGEGQFGPDHWRLSRARRLYYRLKPILPDSLVLAMRRAQARRAWAKSRLGWPVEERYARFQWEIMQRLLATSTGRSISFIGFWPKGHSYALVLTHDVERAQGLGLVRAVADLEESLGFRSSFNFVQASYTIDAALLQELGERGFEVGVHGLTHDERLFSSFTEFTRGARRINECLRSLGATGFRSPSTHRQPEWMQALDVEYDLSFFDTDPFEPIAGGTMSIWPFEVGKFLELPYTLAQDSTLLRVLNESTPRLWLDKRDLIERYHGMALVNTHPDYLVEPRAWRVYTEFLEAVKAHGGYWHALPREVARWWRARTSAGMEPPPPGAILARAKLGPDGQVAIDTVPSGL